MHPTASRPRAKAAQAVYPSPAPNVHPRSAGRRELYTALSHGTPIIVVHETDESKGGAPLDEMSRECLGNCVDHPEGMTAVECCELVFGSAAPITWVSFCL